MATPRALAACGLLALAGCATSTRPAPATPPAEEATWADEPVWARTGMRSTPPRLIVSGQLDVSPSSPPPGLPGLTVLGQGYEALEGGFGLRTVTIPPPGPLQGLHATALMPVAHGALLVRIQRLQLIAVEVGLEGGWTPKVGALARVDVGLRLTLLQHVLVAVHPFNPSVILLAHGSGGLQWGFPTALELGAVF